MECKQFPRKTTNLAMEPDAHTGIQSQASQRRVPVILKCSPSATTHLSPEIHQKSILIRKASRGRWKVTISGTGLGEVRGSERRSASQYVFHWPMRSPMTEAQDVSMGVARVFVALWPRGEMAFDVRYSLRWQWNTLRTVSRSRTWALEY